MLLMEQSAKNICKTVISGKEQNLNKQIAEFLEFPYFFNTLCAF